MNVNIGCGPDIIIGYQNYDINKPENPISEVKYVDSYLSIKFEPNTVEKIRSLYALHSIPAKNIFGFLQNCYAWLQNGGELYIELNDAYLISNDFANGFIDIAKYNALVYDNKKITSFTLEDFENMATEIGFKILDKGIFGHAFYITLTK